MGIGTSCLSNANDVSICVSCLFTWMGTMYMSVGNTLYEIAIRFAQSL